ncbi:MAG: glutathione peroxidase [Proteobacteria bacterium]|nr:glutathione peroxidase [Pseudomonadota bacterium]NDA64522.1 glutathione peroxidase [Chitinophagia bacterium]NDG26974.1 glutathione peroxidase [Pseudomonadota bacterium]
MVTNTGFSKTVHEFEVETLQGKKTSLKSYSGKVLLIVNTASKCGYTPQYQDLQSLYNTYKGKGLVVLGFPSNDFGSQEPGTNAEIASFCQKNYGVTFPMFSKGPVTGESKQALFKFLTEDSQSGLKGEVQWNFEKFLVDKKGNLVARFRSSVEPKSAPLIEAIETALK